MGWMNAFPHEYSRFVASSARGFERKMGCPLIGKELAKRELVFLSGDFIPITPDLGAGRADVKKQTVRIHEAIGFFSRLGGLNSCIG
jgi:hypothetical protein